MFVVMLMQLIYSAIFLLKGKCVCCALSANKQQALHRAGSTSCVCRCTTTTTTTSNSLINNWLTEKRIGRTRINNAQNELCMLRQAHIILMFTTQPILCIYFWIDIECLPSAWDSNRKLTMCQMMISSCRTKLWMLFVAIYTVQLHDSREGLGKH